MAIVLMTGFGIMVGAIVMSAWDQREINLLEKQLLRQIRENRALRSELEGDEDDGDR